MSFEPKFNDVSSYFVASNPTGPAGDVITGNLTVNGSSVLNGPLNVNGSLTASGNETLGGAMTILGGPTSGSTGLTVGQATAGADRGIVVTGTSNMATINGTSINLTGGLTSQSNSSFLTNILVAGGIYGGSPSTPPTFPIGLNSRTLLTGDASLPNGSIIGYNGTNTVPPNFPLGLLINGQPLSTGITSSSTPGSNNSWWVKFSPPGSPYSFAIIGGSGAFSGGTNGGMTIFGPPYTSVISAVGASVKTRNVLIQYDPNGNVPSNGEVKFFCVGLDGTPSGPGVPVEGFAMVLINN